MVFQSISISNASAIGWKLLNARQGRLACIDLLTSSGPLAAAVPLQMNEHDLLCGGRA